MKTTRFKVENRRIERIEEVSIVGDANVDTFSFEFDNEWDGRIKTAIFLKDGKYYYANLDKNDECVLPSELYGSTEFEFGITGKTENSRLSTPSYWINTNISVYLESGDIENLPDKDVWDIYTEEMLALLAQSQINAENAQTSATSANVSKEAAQASATSAQTSADNAQSSASSANTSATNAQNSATSASESASSANTSKESAEASKNAAKTSEDNAKLSETNARSAKESAQSSATSAHGSATSASSSATSAASSASSAASAAQLAVSTVNSALTNIQNAATSAVGGVSTAETAALNNIENAEDAAIANIQNEGQYYANQIQALSDNYEPNTVEGTDLYITDSASAPIKDISIGENSEITQDGEPTPEDEVDVKVVEGEGVLKVSNKNLFDFAKETLTGDGVTSVIDGTTLTMNGTATGTTHIISSKLPNIFRAGEYYFSITKTFTRALYLRFYDSSDNVLSTFGITAGNTSTKVTLTGEEATYRLYFNPIVGESYDYNTNLQFELNEKSSYIEHKGQSYPITLLEGMTLGKIDNQSSYIYGDIDNWKLHRGIVGVTLNETWDWRKFSTDRYYIASSLLDVKAKPQSALYCNYFGSAKTMAAAKGNNQVYIGTNSAIEFYPDEDFLTQYPTVEDFKSWVSQHNLKVYYQANEPEDVDITDATLISQLNNIKRNMTTYKDGTIIFTVTNVLNPSIKLTYGLNSEIETNEKIAKVQSELDMLKSNFDVKTSPNSDNMNITDAINDYNQGNIKIGDGTEITQKTTEGNNLFNAHKQAGQYKDTIYTVSDDGMITQNISDSSSMNSGDNRNFSLPAGTYTITIIGKSDNVFFQVRNITSSVDILRSSDSTTTFTLTEQSVIAVKTYSATATYPQQYYIMLNEGAQQLPYELYTNGASPNSDYPQDINVVEGECGVEVNDRNFFDKENTVWDRDNGSGYNIWGSGTNTTRIRTSSFPLKGGQSYTISGIPDGISLVGVRTYVQPSGTSTNGATRNRNSFTLADNVNYIHLLFGGTNFTDETKILMKNADIQIQLGEAEMPYVSYKHQSYPITLPEGMFLGSIGTASNYIYGTKDNWKLVSGLGKVVLDGSENWKNFASISNEISQVAVAMGFGDRTGYCDKFEVKQDYSATERIVISAGKTSLYLQINNNRLNSVDLAGVKAWLSANNAILYYVLATPTETQITDPTLISQLNNIIDNLQTYKGGTVVFTSGESLAPNIQFDYMVNPLASMQSDILDMKNAILSLGGEV